ncbi:MAG: GTP cyclohydrolase MptA [Candidatus Heimdallarchaeota archaeon LC_3]|nr:MAG: GTP cyclohydrolase MptA [Candidatus Heimdallarchaeota archaeon LC_3]
MENLVNTQDEKPAHEILLSEAGISNLKTLITITRKNGKSFRFITNVDVTINLPAERKGAHMSRLVESISEIFVNAIEGNESIEMLNEKTFQLLKEKHPFTTATIILNFEFAWFLETPVTNRPTIEVYPIEFKSYYRADNSVVHRASVKAYGNTACPHALLVAEGKRTHVQRAIGSLTVVGKTGSLPNFEDMIPVIENSFSSPTFSVLKTEDEAWVVKNMFERPFFCEDVTRNLLVNADKKFEGDINFHAFVRSEESIHKHDVIARGKIIRNNDLETC